MRAATLAAAIAKRMNTRLSFQVVDADEAIRLVRSHARSTREFLEEIARPRGTLLDRLMRENLISGVVGG
jgi:allophanate hydrolase